MRGIEFSTTKLAKNADSAARGVACQGTGCGGKLLIVEGWARLARGGPRARLADEAVAQKLAIGKVVLLGKIYFIGTALPKRVENARK